MNFEEQPNTISGVCTHKYDYRGDKEKVEICKGLSLGKCKDQTFCQSNFDQAPSVIPG